MTLPGKQPPPQIFDEALRQQRLARAAAGFAGHDFLHQLTARDLADRLETIMRDFDQAVVSGPGAHLLRPALSGRCGVGNLVEIYPAPEHAALSADRSTALVSPAMPFPLADQSCDLAVSLMSLHAVNDLPGALASARRILKPDGLFLAAMPAENTLQELRACLYEAETEISRGVSPRIIPFAMIRDLGGLMQRAGFALPVADVLNLPVTYGDPLRLLKDLRGMGETNCLINRKKTGLRRDILARAMELYREKFSASGDSHTPGSVTATFDIVVLTGWAPHESQQKPLKPGSARRSLAEAVTEFSGRPETDKNQD